MNLQLIEAALKKQFVLKIANVSGTPTFFSDVDGLSWEQLLLRDLTTDMRYQMTFDVSPISQRPDIKGWIDSWVSEKNSVTQP